MGGAFVFKRLPFGLKNGPSSWGKLLDSCLSGIENVYSYLDDLLVYSEDEESHMKTLEEIFRRLDKFGLSLALEKCDFGKENVEYLGYHVSTAGLRPLKPKIEAIQKIPPPTTQKELLQFLGALNYFRANLKGLVKDGKFHNTANNSL